MGMLCTVRCEAIFNTHHTVYRSALVGRGEYPEQTPVIIIEPYENFYPKNVKEEEEFRRELLELGSQNEVTREIREIKFYRKFPTDIRHNAKIFREKLKRWVETGKLEEDSGVLVKIGDLIKRGISAFK
jgi:acyl-coenzyme A synthetase/AMP-(fatty) acid ligase